MHVLPAMDILDAKVVRLAQGDYAKVTVYQDDPILQAQLFEEGGAEWIHVVDLDGARTGVPTVGPLITNILKLTALKVEVGGGVRSLDSVHALADSGVNRIVLGTALVKDPDFAQKAVEIYGDLLAAGVDARYGAVALEGWRETSELTPKYLARTMADLGYRHLVFTDISRDGMQTGVDPYAYVHLSEAFGNPVIASGGVASLKDIKSLLNVEASIEGVIVGRALYERAFTLEEAVALCAGVLVSEPISDESRPLTPSDLEG